MAVTAEEMDMQNQALLEQDQGDGFDEASAAPVLVDDEICLRLQKSRATQS